MTRGAPGEMTTQEAVAYLNEWLDFSIGPKSLYSTRSALGVPVAEKRGSRLVFRRETLDAFLAEYGTNPDAWSGGWSRGVIDDMRAHGIDSPAIEDGLRRLDPDPDGWHPDDATR